MEINKIKEVMNQIGESIIIVENEEITIKDFYEQKIPDRKDKEKENQYEKFCYFVPNLLLRGEKGKKEINGKKYYISNILAENLLVLGIDNEFWSNEKYLFNLVKKSHYKVRWKNPVGKILKQSKEIFENDNKNLDLYLMDANSYFKYFRNNRNRDGYFQCDYRNIKFVGYKTRDLALSIYLDSVLAVDIHLKRVPHKLGFTKLSDLPEAIWVRKSISNSDYKKIAKFYIHLAHQLGITPHRFDRYIWNFASEICKEKNPLCNQCKVKNCPDRLI